MLEYQYIADREQKRQQKSESWLTTILILIIIAMLVIFVHRSDQEHERRDRREDGYKTTISMQSKAMAELAEKCQGPVKEKAKRAP